MKAKSLQTSQEKSLSKDNTDVLGVKSVAKADGNDELMQALDKVVEVWDQVHEAATLSELQSLAKQALEASEEEGPKKLLEYVEKTHKAALINGVINGAVLQESVGSKNMHHALKLRKELIAEHKATSVTELMMIDLAINAYFRGLRSAKVYSSLMENNNGRINTEQSIVNVLKEMGKQIESASRQFMSALTTLKEMKQPPVKVKIQTKEAYIAQNQQINNGQTPNDLGKNYE